MIPPLLHLFRRVRERRGIISISVLFIIFIAISAIELQIGLFFRQQIYHTSLLERMLEREGFCDIMQIFLTTAKKVKQTDQTEIRESCNNVVAEKPENTDFTLKSFLVNAAMALALTFFSAYAVLDAVSIMKEKKKTEELEVLGVSRKCSLAEFATVRHSRRNSFISSTVQLHGVKKDRGKQSKLIRFESLGSAYTRLRRESMLEGVTSQPTGAETPNTSSTVIRSPLKLLGARPPPLLRRSSFPAVIAQDGTSPPSRRGSIDSDDSSSDTSRRRSRLIRRH